MTRTRKTKAKDQTVEIEPAAPKKKKKRARKKSASKEIATVSTREKKRANKKLEARLERSKQKLAEMAVEAEVIPASKESVYFDEYHRIFESLQDLMTIAEDKYRDSEQSRDIYALMAMYSQMRECIADMRSIQDMNEMSERLISSILDPFFKAIGQVMVEQFYKQEKAVKTNVKNSTIAEELTAELRQITSDSAQKMQDQYSSSRELVYRYFSEST